LVKTPDWLPALAAAVDSDEVLQIAQQLVRAPSVNPPGDEREVAEIVVSHLQPLAMRELDTIATGETRRSVVGRFGASGSRVLAWNGHTDVVSPGEPDSWTAPPFSATVSNGRLWGRGAVDMKGSVACVIHALQAIERAGIQLEGEVALSIVADEETGGEQGTAYLAREGFYDGADAGICGEPSSFDAVVAARGRLWLEVDLTGTSAHASQPERGVNAVLATAALIERLRRLKLKEGHPLVGAATLTPTMVAGGSSPNSVPDRCTVTFDRRLLPGEDPGEACAALRDVLDGVKVDEGVDYELRQRALFDPTEIDAETQIVLAVQDAGEHVFGVRPAITGMSGSTDARFLIAAGVPTVIFGPGDASDAHTIDESIAVDDLRRGALTYAAAMCQFLGAR
jgi:acetylornithine deacetylase/succinyl-diaminopimelate desuccinylase family protein